MLVRALKHPHVGISEAASLWQHVGVGDEVNSLVFLMKEPCPLLGAICLSAGCQRPVTYARH